MRGTILLKSEVPYSWPGKKTFSSLSRIYGTKEAKLLVGRNVYESRGKNFGEKPLELNKKLVNTVIDNQLILLV